MYARAEGMPNGIMIYWKEVPEAAVYRVRLFIKELDGGFEYRNNQKIKTGEYLEIAVVEEPRNIRYHSFLGLAHLDSQTREYFVNVEAEDRSGKVVDKREKMSVYLPILSVITL